jgi:protein-disulfide isomerase
MADRREQKAALRAQREAREREQAAAARRRRRLFQLGAVVAAAAVIVVAAIVISSAGSSSPSAATTGAKASRNSAAVAEELAGLPQSGAALGRPSAPVTMQYYGDLECPVCRDFTLGTLPAVIANQVRPGTLRLEYRSLQTATRDQSTFVTQQSAALAAGRQHRLWQFVELFYREQGEEGTGYVTPGYLQGLARQVAGLDVAKWSSERADPALANQVAADARAARAIGASATPTLVIKGPGGTKAFDGDVPYSDIAAAIKSVKA